MLAVAPKYPDASLPQLSPSARSAHSMAPSVVSDHFGMEEPRVVSERVFESLSDLDESVHETVPSEASNGTQSQSFAQHQEETREAPTRYSTMTTLDDIHDERTVARSQFPTLAEESEADVSIMSEFSHDTRVSEKPPEPSPASLRRRNVQWRQGLMTECDSLFDQAQKEVIAMDDEDTLKAAEMERIDAATWVEEERRRNAPASSLDQDEVALLGLVKEGSMRLIVETGGGGGVRVVFVY